MVTRRCSERRFFMRPDAETNNAFLYCLGYAANRTAVDVLFFMACSNHYHAGIVDREGRLPEFLECFHKLFAKHQNVKLGRWESFWAPEQTSVVELVEPGDVLAKATYALSNPVKDNLVARADEWPGASSLKFHPAGAAIVASRPLLYFRPDGPMPPTVSFTLAPLPGFEHMAQGTFADLLLAEVQKVESGTAARRKENGTPVLGRAGVLKQRPEDRPKSFEPRRALSPRVACRNTWRRIEALTRNKEFQVAYMAARDLFLAGLDVVFPAGCYWLRRFVGVRCEPGLPELAAA